MVKVCVSHKTLRYNTLLLIQEKYFVNYCGYITNSVQNNHNIFSRNEITSILNKFQWQIEQKDKNEKKKKHPNIKKVKVVFGRLFL